MRILIPKEHGAWGILLVPYLIGLSVAGRWNVEAFLLFGAVLFLYFARYPLVLWARSGFDKFPEASFPTFLFSSIHGLFLGALLIFKYGLWLLAPIGVIGFLALFVHLLLVRRRMERTEVGEFIGISALTLTAPAAFYVSNGTMSEVAPLLWFLCLLYFGTSVFYVKMKVASHFPRGNPRQSNSRKFAKSLALYQTAALASIAVLSYFKLVPALTFLAYVPLILQMVAGTLDQGKQFNIRRLGYTLVVHSVVYGLILVTVFRVSPVGLS